MGFNKEALPLYVEQNSNKLIRDVILGSDTAKEFTLQTGVKTNTALNLVSTNIVFQDGSKCGFDAQGESVLSQRTITANPIKVNMNWCDKELMNTALQHDVRVAAGQKTLPFEAEFVGDVIANVNNAYDRMLWMGDTESEDAILKWTDGIVKHLTAADGITVSTQKLTHTKGNYKEAVDAVIKAIPSAVIKNATVYMGWDFYRGYIMDLQAANLYHNAGDGLTAGEAFYQGSTIRIKAVSGLDGTGIIVAGDKRNFFHGVDMLGDQEKFDLWYSKDNREFRLAVEFNLGSQVAYPNKVVISQNAK